MIFKSGQNKWSKVEHLFARQIATLAELGYPAYQIRSILEDMLRDRKLSQLTPDDIMLVRAELDQYIEFAQNCYKSTHK